MSELVRRLQILTPEIKELRGSVPDSYMRGIGRAIEITPAGSRKITGASPKEVAAQADELTARFATAKKQSDKIASRIRSSGKQLGDEERERMVSQPFEELVSQVRQYGKEDGSSTVLAGIASALLRLDGPTRDMVLRQAGNPEVFEAIREDGGAAKSPTPESPPSAPDPKPNEQGSESQPQKSIYSLPSTHLLAALLA